MENRILEPSGSPRTRELVGELLFLPPVWPLRVDRGSAGDKPLSKLQPRARVLGDQVCLGVLELLPNCPGTHSLIGFGYGCPGGGALDLQACPSGFSNKLPCSKNTSALG